MVKKIINKVICEYCKEYFSKDNKQGFIKLKEYNYKGFVKKIYFCCGDCLDNWKYGDNK